MADGNICRTPYWKCPYVTKSLAITFILFAWKVSSEILDDQYVDQYVDYTDVLKSREIQTDISQLYNNNHYLGLDYSNSSVQLTANTARKPRQLSLIHI